MKKIIALMAFFICTEAHSARIETYIDEVGLSKNSDRVFVDTTGASSLTTCEAKDEFALDLTDDHALSLYSAALAAIMSGKRMRIQYSLTECLNGASVIEVFWNLSD